MRAQAILDFFAWLALFILGIWKADIRTDLWIIGTMFLIIGVAHELKATILQSQDGEEEGE